MTVVPSVRTAFRGPFRHDPEKFDPERFRKTVEKFSYFPFGGLAHLHRRLSLAQSTPVVPRPVITLRARGGIRMTAHARH